MLLCQKTSYKKKLSTSRSLISDALYLAEVFEQLSPFIALLLMCLFWNLWPDFIVHECFPRAAVTHDHKLGCLKQRSLLSPVRRPEVQSHAIGTIGSFLESHRENLFHVPSPACGGCQLSLAFCDLQPHNSSLCLLYMAIFPLCLSSRGILLSVGVCLSISPPLLIKTVVILD